MAGTRFHLEVTPKIPARLERLEELASDLWYGWDRPTRALFSRMHIGLWHAVRHSPKAFLKRVDQERLARAAADPVFLGAFHRVLSAYDTYHGESMAQSVPMANGELVAYLCAEFGFHESLPIYSGGLGILAGDHCKAASDIRLPFVAVGLLYRQGYFHQTIDGEGNQLAVYADSDFEELPVSAVMRDGVELHITVPLPGRELVVKVWQAKIGHVKLYLLDTDLPENDAHDRDITHRLYGGDHLTRIEQEIVLGVGGARALAALGLNPTVWHMNEGHAAFLVLERVRQFVRQGLPFEAAMDAVAANTVFTTHTPVAAGHDRFSTQEMHRYFDWWCHDVERSHDVLLSLGKGGDEGEFSMVGLALRGSRFHNGVSRIHGQVAARLCAHMWPEIDPEENPVDYVTNGVHLPTFLANDWRDVFERYLGPGWDQRLDDPDAAKRVSAIPDNVFWSVRQLLKIQMLHLVRHRVAERHARNHGSESHLDRMLRLTNPNNPNILTIGFARRFATYKRATLILQDLDWLRSIICNPERPVLLIFAGKAHPADLPGQALLRRVEEIAQMREFEGHILLVEGYDLQLARRLVSGVDVWLNNPVFPLEASGTSGMKAAMNGVLNLSVLDGWWGEGYDGKNGWAVKPASSALDDARRDQEEARTLYETLQDKVIPRYYDRGTAGIPTGWVAMAKHAIASLSSNFSAGRMVQDYVRKFYLPAALQWQRFSADDFAGARALAAWKDRVRHAWHQVGIRRINDPLHRIRFGEAVRVEVAVNLGGLSPQDVVVELLFSRPQEQRTERIQTHSLQHIGALPPDAQHYMAEFAPDLCGKLDYRIRVYPTHELLTHRFEMGMMKWL